MSLVESETANKCGVWANLVFFKLEDGGGFDVAVTAHCFSDN